jgi:hypothetical protein
MLRFYADGNDTRSITLTFVTVALEHAIFCRRTDGVDRDHCSEPGSRLVKGGCAWWNTSPHHNLRDYRSLWHERITCSTKNNQ